MAYPLTPDADEPEKGPPRAILYLRVSTPSQVKTDYDPEGLSIPAQREACQRKATQMGVEVVDEYVEPGRSATSIDKRPEFQAMLQRIREQRDVQYVIVYKLSRMNRNRVDDALVLMALRKLKVTLVSATENIDETPVGQLTHGILAAFNEFRSAEDGADIRYKMGQKAKNGGTLGRAKLGYINVREKLDDGREVRTVAVDPERGAFVSLAFELFATGEYTLEQLADALTDRGLRTRPTARRPAGPISDSKLSVLLRDRYYLGYVTYQGVEYHGRQEPLVSPEVFDRVQQVLESRRAAGERQRKHHHYLKGSLWCGRCHFEDGRESRMLLQRAEGNGGVYWYFFCRARYDRLCIGSHRAVDEVEDAVLRHYATVTLSPALRDRVRALLLETVADQDMATQLLHSQLRTQLARLEVQEENLLDLAADDQLPQAKIRTRLHRIQEQRTKLTAQLREVDDRLDAGVAILEATLDLLDNPQELYRQTTDQGRRLLNQALFTHLYVGDDGITADGLQPPFRGLIGIQRAARQGRPVGSEARDTTENQQAASGLAAWDTEADLLAAAVYDGDGSSRTAMVELRGIEPLTSSMRPRRSTN